MKNSMIILTCVLIGTALLSFSCAGTNKQLRKNRKSITAILIPETEKKQILEPTVEIKEVEEKLIPFGEKLPDPSRFFVIIGSFRYPENAKKYQMQILTEGFNSEILRNEAGLYRVSVMSTNEIAAAREDIRRIRRTFPEYSETWLLIQKK
jgi:cell division protein FtsN